MKVKFIWLTDKRKVECFDHKKFSDVDDPQFYGNVENDGDGRSYYIYLRDIKSGVYKKAVKCKKYIGFFGLFGVSGVNSLVSLYGFLDSNSASVIQVCTYLIFVGLFFGFNVTSIGCLSEKIKKFKFNKRLLVLDG